MSQHFSHDTATRDFERQQALRRAQRIAAQCIMYAVLAFLSFLVLFPFIWMVFASFKPFDEFLSNFSKVLPVNWTVQNYTIIGDVINLWRGYFNTFVVEISVIPCGTFFVSMAAFAFAKLRLRHKTFWLLFLLSGMMVPGAVLLMPRYIAYRQLNWINTLLPLILPHLLINVSMMFFFIQYLMGVPSELVDAAKIDGCGYLTMHITIIIPLMAPAIAAQVIFWFMGIWNDYFAPSVYLTQNDVMTLQAMLAKLNSTVSGTQNMPMVFAGAVMSCLPMIVVYVIFQKFFIKSIAIGAVTG